MRAKALFACFLTMTLLLSAFAMARAEEPVKIVYNVGVAPLKFEDENKQPAGLFPDLWRLWARKTGREIQFIKTETFGESLDMVKSGKADLHGGLFKTAEREEFLDYSEPIFELNYYLFTHPTVNTISDIEDTSGLIVGIQAGGFTENWVRKRVPAERIVVYPSFSELFDAAVKGDIKVFVATRISLLYYLGQNRMANMFSYDRQKPLFSQIYYSAGAKGKTPLIEAVNEGLRNMDKDEREQLEDKWIVHFEKIIPADFAALLSEEERLYLATLPPIRVHNETDWAPFNFNVDGAPKGFSIDYMNLLADKCGLEVHYDSGPSWDEFLSMIKTDKLDVMLNIAESPERKKYLEFTPSYITMTQVLYTRGDFPMVKSIKDLFGKRFAMPKGFYLQDILKDFPDVQIVEVADTSEAIYAVSTGKADALFDLMPVVNYLTKQMQITNLKVGGDIGLVEGKPIPLHIAVSKKNTLLAGILEKGMRKITDEELAALHQKWFGQGPARRGVIDLTAEEKAWVNRHKTPIIIGAEMDWPPFDFVRNGRATGFSNELARLVANKAGLSVEFAHGYSWAELVEKFKAGEIDVLPAMYLTPERQTYIDFTSSYAGNPSVLVVREDRSDVKTLADLKGLTVAIVSGFSTADILRDRHPEIKRAEVKNVEEGLKAVSLKRVDAFIGSLGVINHIIENVIIPDIQIVGEVWLQTREETELHMGVVKENSVLRDILQKGLDAVTNEERRNLLQDWLPSAIMADREKERVNMSAQERRWLSNHETIRLAGDFTWPPFSFLDKDNRFAGIASGYTEVISDLLDVKIEPVTGLTRQEAMAKLKSGEIDVLPAVVRTNDLEKELDFTKPYISLPIVMATQKEGIFVDSLDDLAGKNVGVVSGSTTQLLLSRDFPKLLLSPFSNLEEGLMDLNRGKIEAFVDDLGSITYEVDKHGLDNIKIAAPTQYRFDLHFGVRKDLPELTSILNKALGTIDERKQAEIKNTWMAVEITYGLGIDKILNWAIPIGSMFILLILFIVIWNRRLAFQVRERTVAEQKIQAMSSAIHDAMIMIDGQARVMYWNHAAEILFAIPSEEAMGKDMHELFAPDKYKESAKAGLEHFAKSGQGPVLNKLSELTALRSDGFEFPVEVGVSAFQVDDEWYAVGTVRDITERKKAEELLRESENRLEMALTSSNTGLWDYYPLEKKDFHNDQWYRQLGYSRDDFDEKGDHLTELMHPDDLDKHRETTSEEALMASDDYRHEFRMKAKDGTWKWILSVGKVTDRDENGRAKRLIGVHLDITERIQSEQALMESEKRVRTIVDSVNTGIILVDPDKRTLVDANPVALEMIGADLEDLVGKECHFIICPSEKGACPILDHGLRVENAEHVLLTADGGQIPVLKTVVPVELGGKEYLLESFVDLTERKKAEKELRKNLEELQRFNRLVIGRELKMIELKKEVNEMLKARGQGEKYKIVK